MPKGKQVVLSHPLSFPLAHFQLELLSLETGYIYLSSNQNHSSKIAYPINEELTSKKKGQLQGKTGYLSFSGYPVCLLRVWSDQEFMSTQESGVTAKLSNWALIQGATWMPTCPTKKVESLTVARDLLSIEASIVPLACTFKVR